MDLGAKRAIVKSMLFSFSGAWSAPVVKSFVLPAHASIGSSVCCLRSQIWSVTCDSGIRVLNGNFDNFGRPFVVTGVYSSVPEQTVKVKLNLQEINFPVLLPNSGTLNVEVREQGLGCSPENSFSMGSLIVSTGDETTTEFVFRIPEGLQVVP